MARIPLWLASVFTGAWLCLFAWWLPAQAEDTRATSFPRWLPPVTWTVSGNLLVPPDLFQSANENAKFELYVTPRIVVQTWSEQTDLSAYVTFGALKDRNVFTYNNKLTIALGIQVRHRVTKALRVRVGARWKIEQEASGAADNAFQLTLDADWWKSWRPDWLPKALPKGSRLVFSGWSNFRYPASAHPFEAKNGLLQGSGKLALDMPMGKRKLKLSPFFSVKAKWDIRKRPYNNYVEPALGLDLKVPLKGGGQVTFGIKAAQQFRTTTRTRESGGIAYVSWYKSF
ncbi:MAG: hypothetical protein AAF631_04945 [Pseudomonadota bacterium]